MRKTTSFVFALATIACGGTGKIAVTAYGEAFIEVGISAEDVDDGWAITFTRFEVAVADVVIAGTPVAVAGPLDLTQSSNGKGHVLGTISVQTGRYTNASFAIAELRVEGAATKGGVQKTFAWTFPQATKYTKCSSTTEVAQGGSASFEITVHADHFFLNSIASDEPAVLFGALADADANNDGQIAEAELRAKGIGSYDPGNEDAANLWEWLTLLSRTVGHADGEHHCTASD